MLLPDVNVLVYAHIEDSITHHEDYANWVTRLATGPEPFALSAATAAPRRHVATRRSGDPRRHGWAPPRTAPRPVRLGTTAAGVQVASTSSSRRRRRRIGDRPRSPSSSAARQAVSLVTKFVLH